MLSRVGISDVQIGVPGLPSWGDPAVAEARAIGAVCGGVRVWSLYVPNGRAVDDPHYYYKLDWLAALRDYGAKQLAADPHAQMAFCGDFNIAPTDDDIWSVEYYQNSTHVTGTGAAGVRRPGRRRLHRRGAPVHTRARASTPTGTTPS